MNLFKAVFLFKKKNVRYFILPLGFLGIFPLVFTVTVGGSSMFLSSESSRSKA